MHCHTEANNVLNTSDHFPIQTVISIDDMPGVMEYTPQARTLRWDKVNQEAMQELYEIPLAELIADIVNIEYDPTEPLSNIDVQFDRIVNAMHSAALNLPTSRFASHLKPYWSNELNNLR